ncbi:MAG: diacylglycerol kinase family lipid kinase [Terracidiphilus sp.]|nr:diacylglycerol kinase family lipid kinase [Terracidiphilus sp.]
MRKAALIYNPISGQKSAQRQAAIDAVIAALRAGGVDVIPYETDGPGSGAALAQQAASEGCDAVVVCGGDGTVHQVLQGLAGTAIALGVVPFGTANALATSLGIAGPPERAVKKLLTAEPVRMPAGRIYYRNRRGEECARYFLVAAGVGPDARLMAEMDPKLKRRLGYILYLVDGFRIWASGRFPLFEAHFDESGSSHTRYVSQLLAVRVRSFGGAVGSLAPGASLLNPKLHLLAFSTQSRWHYLRFVVGVALGRHPFDRAVELVEATRVECVPHNGSRDKLRAEADGEPLGTLPVRMEIVQDAVTLLVPKGARA